MALIIIQIGLAEKLITSEAYSTLVIVVILSTIIAPFILKYSFKGDSDSRNLLEPSL
ncbi:transporter, CPA2 domain protein [Streptococcus ictaluri 707-05]|uniref:Transporter, CPA2 domain protein n=1 Tax=Streptococcus ictaluri 707-05 TaxID=764299 RepID=G5K3B7_9STRE|nr:transporter, CPA2 domain protein [Streptococcus ictaluri 707-05]